MGARKNARARRRRASFGPFVQALPLPRVYPSRAPVLSCAHFLAPATQGINLVILRTFTFDDLRMSVGRELMLVTTVTRL